MENDDIEAIARRFACDDWPLFDNGERDLDPINPPEAIGIACLWGGFIMTAAFVVAAIYWSFNAPPV